MNSFVHKGRAYGGMAQEGRAYGTGVVEESHSSRNNCSVSDVSRYGAAALTTGQDIVQEARKVLPKTGAAGGGMASVSVIHRRSTGIGNS